MRQLFDWLLAKENKTQKWGALIATCAHAWLTDIHPFEDGNGRTARLLANLLLAHGNLPPLVIKHTTDRPRYLNALNYSDEAGDIFPLFRLFMEIRLRKLNELIKNYKESIYQSIFRTIC
mgnify:CR=1 FL=1